MNYRNLKVWSHAVDIAVEIHDLTLSFPDEERYCLTPQIRRAALSVPSNVAEGDGMWSPRHHLRFLGDARGSLYEVDTQVVYAARVGYIADPTDIRARIEEEARLINGTIRHVNQQRMKRPSRR